MTRLQELRDKADHFSERAAQAKARTERNTFLSLAQSCRSLAAIEEAVTASAAGAAKA